MLCSSAPEPRLPLMFKLWSGHFVRWMAAKDPVLMWISALDQVWIQVVEGKFSLILLTAETATAVGGGNMDRKEKRIHKNSLKGEYCDSLFPHGSEHLLDYFPWQRAELWHIIILVQMGGENGTLEITTYNYKIAVPAHCWLHHYYKKWTCTKT